jgi:uncharacterized membrane protein
MGICYRLYGRITSVRAAMPSLEVCLVEEESKLPKSWSRVIVVIIIIVVIQQIRVVVQILEESGRVLTESNPMPTFGHK